MEKSDVNYVHFGDAWVKSMSTMRTEKGPQN